MSTTRNGPLHAYVALRKYLDRISAMADAGDWEEALASLDEARIAVQFLERFQRLTANPKKDS